jgi:hypothetical protein
MTLNMNIKIIAPFRQFLFFAVPVFLFFLLGVFSYLPMLGWIAAWILLLIFSIFNNFSALFIEKFATYAFASLLFLGVFLAAIYGIALAFSASDLLPSSDLLASAAFWNMFWGLIIVHLLLLLLVFLLRQSLLNRYSRK